MTVTVSKATIYENIFKNFYDVIAAISGFSSNVYPVFPEIVIDAKADYPIIVIDPAEVDWSTFTFGKGIVEGSIMVEVHTITAKDTDERSSDISMGIEAEKDTLAGVGLRQIQQERSSSDVVPHGDIRLFIRSLPFSFKYYYTKTRAF